MSESGGRGEEEAYGLGILGKPNEPLVSMLTTAIRYAVRGFAVLMTSYRPGGSMWYGFPISA